MERKDIVFARERDVISPLSDFYPLHEEHNLNLEQSLFKPTDHTTRGALLGCGDAPAGKTRVWLFGKFNLVPYSKI